MALKRVALAALLLGCLVTAGSVQASNVGVQGGMIGSPLDGFKTLTVTLDTQTTLPVGTVLLGMKIIAGTGGNSGCGYYDVATMTKTTASAPFTGIIDELYEQTAQAMDVQWWPRPVRIKNGLTILAVNATCSVFYE